jgi:CRP/FNR family cyclic AMP-dependent transcriptional regulator
MEIQTASVLNAGDRAQPVAAASRRAEALGLAALAQGRTERDPELAGAAANLTLDMALAHLQREEALVHRVRRDAAAPDEALLEAMAAAVRRAALEVHALLTRRHTEGEVDLDLVIAGEGRFYVCHVGSGRVYLLRGNLLHRLTRDPAPVPAHPSAPEEAARALALGRSQSVEPELLSVRSQPGDRLLMLSAAMAARVTEAGLRACAGDPVADGAAARALRLAREGGAAEPLGINVLDLGQQERRRAEASRLRTLQRAPLFAFCTEPELLAVAGFTRPVTLPAGAVLFREGAPGQEMYLVVAGAVDICKGEQVLATMGPGTNFGEMALLDEPQRSATARIALDAELLVIDREAFFRFLKTDATLAVKVLWNMLLKLSSNLRDTSARLAAAGESENP